MCVCVRFGIWSLWIVFNISTSTKSLLYQCLQNFADLLHRIWTLKILKISLKVKYWQLEITTYYLLTRKGNSATSGLEGIFPNKLKPHICSRSISARTIGSLLTLKLIGSDWRLRLLHFHVNLIKKENEVVR